MAGMPPESAALTVNQVCGSGLRAVSLGAQAIQTGDADFVVAGGMESMTNAPYLLPQARSGYRMGNGTLVDAMINDGLWEAYRGYHMGVAAEMIAEKYGISREEQDAFRRRVAPPRCRGHRRGLVPRRHCASGDSGGEEGRSAAHLRQGRSHPAGDDGRKSWRGSSRPSRREVRSRPAMLPESATEPPQWWSRALRLAKERGLKPLAVIRAQATAGREPEWFGLAPIDAVRKVAKQGGLAARRR